MAKTRKRAAASVNSDRPHLTPTSRREWRAWLRKHHASAAGVWLMFPKKHTGLPAPSYNDAVEEALCFGWIDGLMNPVDERHYKQLFTPRKSKSAWAESNKARVARLIAQGLMTKAGLAAIELAKANGSWSSLDDVVAMTVPPELRKALNAHVQAKRGWERFTDSRRRQFLYRLAAAKRDETRARRIAEIVDWAARGTGPWAAEEARRRTSRRA